MIGLQLLFDLREFAGELARVVEYVKDRCVFVKRKSWWQFFQTNPPNVFFFYRERIQSNIDFFFFLLVGLNDLYFYSYATTIFFYFNFDMKRNDFYTNNYHDLIIKRGDSKYVWLVCR